MADDADAIRTGDLERRLSESRRNDDLDVLARRFNATFSDLQRSLDGVRHVSGAIAHDLRRPLIRLRQQLETAARASQQDGGTEAPIADALQAVDASLAVFAAILRLARIEAGALGHTRQTQDLGVIVADAAELIRPLYEQHSRELCVQVAAASVVGDRDLLFQLVHNLLENALRHGAGAVTVRVIAGVPAQLVVCDQGEGVAPEDIAHLGERFWRADTARSSEGSGLGLSLCRAIAEAHEGRITFTREEGGFSVRASLPGLRGVG